MCVLVVDYVTSAFPLKYAYYTGMRNHIHKRDFNIRYNFVREKANFCDEGSPQRVVLWGCCCCEGFA